MKDDSLPDLASRAPVRQAVEQIGEEEFYYICHSIEKKVAALKRSGTKWIRDLAIHCDALHKIYLDHTDGLRSLPEEQLKVVGAALFYFVNPYDIIPDYDPGSGYLDDAHVVNLCADNLDKFDPKLLTKHIIKSSRASDNGPKRRVEKHK